MDRHVYINCGYQAVKNGAVAPIKAAFDIRDLTGACLIWDAGVYYGNDYYLCINDEEYENVIMLLKDAKIPYYVRIHGQPRGPWENLSEELKKEYDKKQ